MKAIAYGLIRKTDFAMTKQLQVYKTVIRDYM
jgi:hypothetical protein